MSQAHPTPAQAARALPKGQQTRAAILDAALAMASHMGLEGLSIGALAEVTGMSKSGVFAHFGSREELQISVIREYHHRFEEEVFFPAIREPRTAPEPLADERRPAPHEGHDREHAEQPEDDPEILVEELHGGRA